MPRKRRRSRLYWKMGRAYADFRDLGGKLEAIKQPGSKLATNGSSSRSKTCVRSTRRRLNHPRPSPRFRDAPRRVRDRSVDVKTNEQPTPLEDTMSKTKKAPAKKVTSAKPRWSIGLFRNASGKLVTVYVTADGVVMPYEKKRLNGNGKILFHSTYSGMKYSQAQQKLLKDSGLKDEPVEKEVAKKK